MERDFKIKWLGLILNKEGVLVGQKNWLEVRFGLLITLMLGVGNYFIDHMRRFSFNDLYIGERFTAFMIMFLMVFWTSTFFNLSELAKYKKDKALGYKFRRNILPIVLFMVTLLHLFVIGCTEMWKITSSFLWVSSLFCFLAVLVQFKANWLEWYLAKRFEQKYDISMRLILGIICLGSLMVLFFEYGIFNYVWKTDFVADFKCAVALWIILTLLKKAYDAQTSVSSLKSIQELQVSIVAGRFKTESELKQCYSKILSED